VKAVCIDYDCAIWLSTHTAKANKRADVEQLTARGASASEGDAHWVAYFFMEEDKSPTRYFRLGKIRYTPHHRELSFTSTLHESSGVDKYGYERTERYFSVVINTSSEEQRQLKKAEFVAEKDVVTQKHILELVRNWDRTTKTVCNTKRILERLGGSQNNNLNTIQAMIRSGSLKVVTTDPKSDPRKLHTNQKYEIFASEFYDENF